MNIKASSLDSVSTRDPEPLHISTCIDLLEINLNSTLMDLMKEHLQFRENNPGDERDTDFERWFHGQLYTAEFNNY